MRRTHFTVGLVIVVLLLVCVQAGADDRQRFADLGDVKLESGTTLKACRIGFRTFGVLNTGKTNVILFPMWLGGKTQDLIDLGMVGPGKLLDASKYFILAMDTPGNGVSISPSNSKYQGGAAFPLFTIRDTANMGNILASRVAGATRLYAFIGVSMGALTALEFGVTFPSMADRVVIIEGAPQISSYAGLWMIAQVRAIGAAKSASGYSPEAMNAVSAAFTLLSRTPKMICSGATVESLPGYMTPIDSVFSTYKPEDWASQLRAIMSHDIYRRFDGSMEKAAAAFRAHPMVVISTQDLLFAPDQMAGFADAIKADTFKLTGDCGHMAFVCEAPALASAVNAFLQKK